MRRSHLPAGLLLTLTVAAGCGGSGSTPPPKDGQVKGNPGLTFNVTVQRGTMGTIASVDGKIDCGPRGAACAATYAWADQVLLTATPEPGHTFGTWLGDCAGSGACVLDTSKTGADKFVGATFGQDGVVQHGNFYAPATHAPAYFATLAGKADALNCSASKCHGPTLDGAGIAPSCNACHAAVGWTSWSTNCSFCHGSKDQAAKAGYDPAVHPEYAAPPDEVATRLGAPATGAAGAHGAHVRPGLSTNGVACGECHRVPTSVVHVNGVDDVAFGAVARAGGATPTWTAGTLSCASTYCHGSFRGGNGQTTLVWTATATITCESCHGNPPAATHATTVTACSACHDGYADKGPGQTVNLATHLNGVVDVSAMSCASCHGDGTRKPAVGQDALVSAAPPRGTHGELLPTDAAVGAHQAHLSAGPLAGPLACTECHAIPTSTSHASGTAELAWGNLATGASSALGTGATPAYDRTALTCASTYCHGAFTNGNGANAPRWTAGGAAVDCGSCHGVPPGGTHPQTAQDCGACHSGYTTATVNPLTHVNGVPEYSFSCTSCHSGPLSGSDANGVALAAAPDVGAHRIHLAGSSVRAALPCASCHVVPTTADHSSQPLDLTFGALARASSAPVSTRGTGTSISCANYCHGATLAGAPASSAPWNTTGTTCGSCHGFPPPTPEHAAVGASAAACATCHPATVTAQGAIDVAGGKHVDGVLQVVALTCTTCHGDSTRRPAAGQDALVSAAPPRGTHGELLPTDAAVGAHQAHLSAGPLAGPLACTECHALPTSTSHATGTADLAWGALATGAGSALGTGATPAFDTTALTCASTYCHGAFKNGNGANAPRWTAGSAAVACDSCHGSPPGGTHPATASDCGACHAGYTTSTVNPLTHVNGIPEFTFSCTSCHSGPLTGTDASGVALAPAPDVGAHRVHLAGTGVRGPLPCASCHVVPTTADHSSQPLDLTFGALARARGVTPATTGTGTSLSCANACHGAGLAGAPASSAAWDTAGTTCASCHGFPPATPAHTAVSASAVACNACHPATVTTQGAIDLAGAKHVDGAIQVIALSCTSCHGDPARTPATGEDAFISAAPPSGTHGESATTDAAVGAHQAHLTAGALTGPLACSDCHAVPTSTAHATGAVDLAWSPLARGSASALGTGATPAFDTTALTCASTYCHGAFKNGNATNAPRWTAGGAAVTCGSCHGLPPGGTHPVTSQDCGSCHTGYTTSTVNVAAHLNGSPDYTMSCTSCHSGALTGKDAQGVDLAVAPAVGAHAAHLDPAKASRISPAVSCDACHVVPSTFDHSSAPLDLTFGALARTGGVTPTTTGTGTSISCANYCHGAGMPGGPFASAAWNTTGTTCTSCHGSPPALPHPQSSACADCHGAGYSSSSVVAATHVNGTVDLVDGHKAGTCARCHGDASRSADLASTFSAAPPAGSRGETATTARAVGAHQAHLVQTTFRRNALACADCHAVPAAADTAHADGAVSLAFTTLASTGGLAPAFDGAACSNVYCHGDTAALKGGAATQPGWTGAFTAGASSLGCTSCHGAPPPGHSTGDCGNCHTGYTAASVNKDLHIDGQVQVDMSNIKSACAQCHAYQSAMAANTTYHHVMGSDVALLAGATNYPANPTPSVSQTDQKNCAMCHVAHDKFNGIPGSNLRADTLGAPTAASSDAGICLSCHGYAQTKDQVGQLSDGTVQTYPLDATAFSVGAHGYGVPGSFTGSSATTDFAVACVKCHSSDAATQYQDGTYRFALHTSPDRRLRAPLGRATLPDDDAEDFCFRCHSNAGDAVGGTAKATSLSDWYGAATMPPGSTGVFTQMTGTPATSTTSTDTLTFKPAAQETVTGTQPSGGSAESGTTVTNTLYFTSAAATNPPAGYLLNSGTYTTSTLRQLAMSTTASATSTSVTVNTTSGTTAYDRVAQFLSPPLSKAASWASGVNFGLALYRSENNTNNNCAFRYAVYRRTGTTQTQIVTTATGTEFPTTAANGTQNMATSAAVTFAAGDQILVEVEIAKSAPTSTGTCNVQWGNTTVDGGRLVIPATSDGTFPEFSGAPTVGGTWAARSMSPNPPTVASETLTGSGTAPAYTTSIWQRASFISPALSAATTLPASPWTLTVYANRGSLATNTAYLRYRIYQWTAAGTQGADIVPWRTSSTALGNTTAAVTITTPAGAALALAAGDKLIVDVEVETMGQTASATANSNILYGSTYPSSLKLPAAAAFSYASAAVVATVGHLGQNYTGIHRPNPAEETLQRLAASKHVECSDCHDPHAARRGNQADGGTVTGGASTTGLADTNQSWVAGAWVGYYVDITGGTGSGGRAQITGNGATTLTFAPALATAPAAGSTYRIAMKANGGAVSSATATTLTDAQSAVGGTKTWQTNAFASWQVNIVVGTGIGQSRTITANTGTQLTVTPAWTTTPDTTSRYVVTRLPGVLTGATGVNVAAWGAGSPTAWGEAITLNPAPNSTTPIPDANVEWQVCFKCHSAANASLTTWKSSWTDSAVAFNPRNQSYHPVVAPAAAFAATGYGNTQLTAAQLTGGWKPGDVMYCSDCHGNSDTTYGASQGPHASAVPFMLRGPNTRWPTQADGTTRWTVGNSESNVGTGNGLFCRNCHPALTGVHTSQSQHNIQCTACHLAIPHGGKVKRLIRTQNTPAALVDGAVTPVLNAYSGGTSSSACGATCTTAHSLGATATNSW